ncbi:DUF4198 domain-containing protein [Winogradskyella aurantiaca]|uniref:DUF4198 domain-containing protein n=1 Tax=Winogradskyella aurantiaca TaxID=2219558 RepID=UPI000E1C55AE|nr:DUF4198 domain-containing protein [Winogradskyella aurantiaca]
MHKKLEINLLLSLGLLIAFFVLTGHDLYLKMDTYFLRPNQDATLSLYNGTFEKSENIITRDRMLDASVVMQGERMTINPDKWMDKDSTITYLPFSAGNSGTYVAGVSTKPRNIELEAEKFNDYLKHDGVLDMLDKRTKKGLLEEDAVESYQKHVKAIYQVGNKKTEDWNTVFGYPIEFVPQSNPYNSYTGDSLKVQLLLDGQPLANQLVYAHYVKNDNAHTHNHDDHGHDHEHQHKHEHGNTEHSHEHDGENHSHDHTTEAHHHESGHSHEHEHDNHSHEHPHDTVNHDHNNDTEHSHTERQQLRTNTEGIVAVNLPEDGIYYIRTIHMVEANDNDELTHVSKWATLTFGVTHRHDQEAHSHNGHDHDHDDEIPTWWFIVGSLLIIGVLFFVFRKKS